MQPTTIKAAFDEYIAACGEEALPPGADIAVVRKAFYSGAVKAIAIISAHNASLETVGAVCMDLATEVCAWLTDTEAKVH